MKTIPVGAPGQTAGEGCFLRTLNIGCMLMVGFVVLVVALFFLGRIVAH